MSATIPTYLLLVQVIWWKVQIMNAGLLYVCDYYISLNSVASSIRW